MISKLLGLFRCSVVDHYSSTAELNQSIYGCPSHTAGSNHQPGSPRRMYDILWRQITDYARRHPNPVGVISVKTSYRADLSTRGSLRSKRGHLVVPRHAYGNKCVNRTDDFGMGAFCCYLLA